MFTAIFVTAAMGNAFLIYKRITAGPIGRGWGNITLGVMWLLAFIPALYIGIQLFVHIFFILLPAKSNLRFLAVILALFPSEHIACKFALWIFRPHNGEQE